MASDLVMIPVQASPYDIWAASEVVKMVEEAMTYRPTLKAAFVITPRIGNSLIGRGVHDALKDYKLPVLKTAISQRIVFAEAASAGRLVAEIDHDSTAAEVISKLTKDILEML